MVLPVKSSSAADWLIGSRRHSNGAAVKIQPGSLDIPLRKRSWFPFWFALGCIGLAAFSIRASRFSQWLTAVVVLGPAYWIAFGGPTFIYRWQNNSVPVLRGLVFILRFAFLLVVLRYIVPLAVALLDRFFGV